MKQLSGLDASFLYMESSTTYGHVNGLAIYERPRPDFDPYQEVRERFGSMVGHVAPLRRRVVEVPFGLDHPYWVDDPHFDLDFHVRQIGLAPPGNNVQLAEQVARIIGRQMDRRHPLWEVYVIEGLPDDRWALLTKFHHATIDGAAGVIMLQMLTSLTPESPWPFEPVEWSAGRIPSDVALLKLTAGRLATNPAKAARLQLRLVRSIADTAGLTSLSAWANRSRSLIAAAAGRTQQADAISDQVRKVALPITPAPPTPWNRSVGPHRRLAMRSAALADIKRLKDATGGTVNDVVMAICAGALREYLLRHDALPNAPLRAMVPVSIRTGEEADPWTNRVSAIVAILPTDIDDPLERVTRCRAAMDDAKRQLDLVPADALMQATDTLSPVVATAAVRLVARLSNRVNLPANVVISNVPGPRQPLYFAGAKLHHYIPVSTITNGIGLNITVHSYEDRLDFGLVADRDLVPDLWDLVDLHIAEIDRLLVAAGLASPVGATKPTTKVRTVTAMATTTARTAGGRSASRPRPRSTSRSTAGPAPASRAATPTRTKTHKPAKAAKKRPDAAAS